MKRIWRELRVMLQWRFPYLKDEEFTFEEGKKETTLARLAARIKMSRLDFDILLGKLQYY